MRKSFYSEGKTTYYVRGKRFFNDKDQRNGKTKAIQYCVDNFINQNEIMVFDSMLECDRFEELIKKQFDGEITDLQVHLIVPLLPESIDINGNVIPRLDYNADFVYRENGKLILEDVKGASIFDDTRFEVVKNIADRIYKEKNGYVRIIIKRNGEWTEWKFGDIKKPSKLKEKQRAKIKEQKQELHKLEMAKNKVEREKKRYEELKSMEKRTKPQQKRLEELRKILKEKGVILDD